jgi:hypothetical protein
MGASLKKRKQFKLPDENEGNVDWVLGDWLENIVATDRTQKVCAFVCICIPPHRVHLTYAL